MPRRSKPTAGSRLRTSTRWRVPVRLPPRVWRSPLSRLNLRNDSRLSRLSRLPRCVSTRSKRCVLSWRSCPSRATPPRCAS
nr:MAG TPA: hypothetical protein [Caudoviricetes sp.]